LLSESIDEQLVKYDIIKQLLVEYDSFQPTLIAIEAHMFKCTQSTHSITAIFAHSAYFALGLNLTENHLKIKKSISKM